MLIPLLWSGLFGCASEEANYSEWAARYPVVSEPRFESESATLTGFFGLNLERIRSADSYAIAPDDDGFSHKVIFTGVDGKVFLHEPYFGGQPNEASAAAALFSVSATYAQKRCLLRLFDRLDGGHDGVVDLNAAEARLDAIAAEDLRSLIAAEVDGSIAEASKPRDYFISQYLGLRVFLDGLPDA